MVQRYIPVFIFCPCVYICLFYVPKCISLSTVIEKWERKKARIFGEGMKPDTNYMFNLKINTE